MVLFQVHGDQNNRDFFVLIALNYLTFKNKHFLQALKYFRLAFHAVSLFYFVGDIYM